MYLILHLTIIIKFLFNKEKIINNKIKKKNLIIFFL